MRNWLFTALILGGAFCGGVFVHAQSMDATDPLTVTLTPEFPTPYSVVTVTPASTLIDLNSSVVSISVNGTVVQKSSGTQPADVAIGGSGKTTTILVTAVTNGTTYTKKILVNPADVALVEEPISTTHPFYKGASLLASQGRVRLIAVPDLRNSAGTQIAASSLIYTWRNDDQLLESASGIGKNVLTAVAPNRYRDTVITVTVSSQNQNTVGQASMPISPIDPIMRIYQNDPLLGPLYNQALGTNVSITDSERTFRAVPYFFSEIPTLGWQVNSVTSQSGQDITVRPTGSGTGSALLAVAAQAANFPQQVAASLSVAFGIAKSTGIFGL
jgi:hypothetical protein